MISIAIKKSKPYVEKVIQAKLNGEELKDNNITIGVKVYDENTLKPLRKEYSEILGNVRLIRLINQLEALPSKLNLSEADFTAEKDSIQGELDKLMEEQAVYQENFIKEHILFIKNVSLELKEEGVIKSLLIDTRDVKPIESLWDTPEQALVVLLELYLKEPAYRDSLLNVVPKLVFGTDFKDKKLGN
jgi:hypothetical protein